MDESELIGGALFDSRDPDRAAIALADLLASETTDPKRARDLGFEPAIVDALRRVLPRDRSAIDIACAKGAAWLRGRRSATPDDAWEPVATMPPDLPLPAGLRRTTAETFIMLISQARQSVRLAAPFTDPVGIGFIATALAAATRRGVTVEIFDPIRSELGSEALASLRLAMVNHGNPQLFSEILVRADGPWPHLKVAVVDERVAYVGSANITAAGLSGRNLELGVLVRGRQVAVVERILDLCRK